MADMDAMNCTPPAIGPQMAMQKDRFPRVSLRRFHRNRPTICAANKKIPQFPNAIANRKSSSP